MSTTRNSLQKLIASAAKLNEKSGRLNDAIADLEDRIQQTGVGVSVWLHRDLTNPGHVPLLHRSEVDHDGVLQTRAWSLGFTKIDKMWRIAARQVAVIDEPGGSVVISRRSASPLR